MRWLAGQHPVAKKRTPGVRRRRKWDTAPKQRSQKWDMFYIFRLRVRPGQGENILFLFCTLENKSNFFPWNWQVFVSGQLTIFFFLPVMKGDAGVNALGGDGASGLSPSRPSATRVFTRSVICNCGISWEAQEQSTLCFERAPYCTTKDWEKKKNQRWTPTPQHAPLNPTQFAIICRFCFFIHHFFPILIFFSYICDWIFWQGVEVFPS